MKSLLSTRDIHVVASEVDIPPQELISGRADAILSDGEQLFVLDIKSMNSMVFRTLKEPKEENINQIQLYLHYFKIQKGILLYVNKDSQDLKEFVVEYNPTRSQKLLDDLTYVKKQIDANTIPSRIPPYPSDWQCQYCQFKEVCKIAEAGEMEWESLKSKIELN
jgi:CRISPR/Cas system-associated exonuclease Cas4 (RecB family)